MSFCGLGTAFAANAGFIKEALEIVDHEVHETVVESSQAFIYETLSQKCCNSILVGRDVWFSCWSSPFQGATSTPSGRIPSR